MWLDSAKTWLRAPSISLDERLQMAGVASSWAPATTRVGTLMPGRRSTTLQSFIEPTTWNSLGPFIVW